MSRRGWLLFGAMGLIWGVPYLLIKVAVAEVSPAVLVFVRTGLGALLLLPIVLRRGWLAQLKNRWWPLLAFAALELVGPWLLLSDAERTLSSSMTGLLVATAPIGGVIVARFWGDRQPIGVARLAGLGLGLGGVALLASPGGGVGGVLPVAEVLLAMVGYAVAPVIAARWLRDVPAMTLTAVCLAVAALACAPWAAASWPARMPSGGALLAMAGLAVLCTAVAFVLFFELINEVGPARATVVAYVNPAVAVTLGALVLGEALTLPMGVAFVMILVGSVFATWKAVAARQPVEVAA